MPGFSAYIRREERRVQGLDYTRAWLQLRMNRVLLAAKNVYHSMAFFSSPSLSDSHAPRDLQKIGVLMVYDSCRIAELHDSVKDSGSCS